jgi:hypothetical protein
LDGTILTTSPFFTSALNEQPTPQYPQVVKMALSGIPFSTMVFSIKLPVGQLWTQAPQETHSDSKKLSEMPGLI